MRGHGRASIGWIESEPAEPLESSIKSADGDSRENYKHDTDTVTHIGGVLTYGLQNVYVVALVIPL